MYQQIRAYAEEAKRHGLVVIIWSYPRGSSISKTGETAIDVCGYAAHLAAQKKRPQRNQLLTNGAEEMQ